MWTSLKFFVRSVLRADKLRHELDDEIRCHLEERADDLEREGLPRNEALRRARLEFGSSPNYREGVQDAHGLRLFTEISQDLRFSARAFRRNPGFAAIVIATLALGIGANAAVFSIVNTVLLRPIDAPAADRIVVFGTARKNQSPTGMTGGAPTRFNAWRKLDNLFDDISAYRHAPMNLTALESPEQVQVAQVSESYFRLFGLTTESGRVFTAAEDRPGGGAFAVISDAFWKRTLFADPQAVGKLIYLGGSPHQVLGVMAPKDDPLSRQTDLWIPFQIDPASTDQSHFFAVAGRVKSGVSTSQIETRLQQSSDAFAAKYPEIGVRLGGTQFVVRPLQQVLDANLHRSLLLLLGAVTFVLLIACANVASLFFARGIVRQRELALRAGLGAGRGRLLRQLVTESLLLWIAGGVLGLVFGLFTSRVLVESSPLSLPRIGTDGLAFATDWRVLLFTLLVTIATALVFGLLPALKASRADAHSLIKSSGGRMGDGWNRNGARSALVVAEIALALPLVVGAGLLSQTFVAMHSVDSGFDANDVLTMQVRLDDKRYADTAGLTALIRDSVRQIEAIPGIEAATAGCCLPIGGVANASFAVVGRTEDSASRPRANMPTVSDGYFSVTRIPILRGRAITDSDDQRCRRVAVINSFLAHQLWPTGDALGAQLAIVSGDSPETFEVIGIAGDVRYRETGETSPTIYLSLAQMDDPSTAYYVRQPTTWMIRTQGPSDLAADDVKAILEKASGLPAISIRPLAEVVAASTASSDFNAALMLAFGGLALILAAVGVFGLMSYNVRRRQGEIGVRLALGAESARVRNLVLVQSARLTFLGLVLGLAGAFALASFLSSLLVGVDAHDPVVFGISAVVISAVALLAAWAPALKASRLDPVAALRHD